MKGQENNMNTALTYPPQHHILRDLQISIKFHGKSRATVKAPIVPALFTDQGAVQVGVLATLVDVLCGSMALKAVYPDWVASADLSICTAKRATSGMLNLAGSVLRSGSNTLVIEATISRIGDELDNSIETIGSGFMTIVRLPRRVDTPKFYEDSMDSMVFATQDSSLSRSLLDEVGIETIDGAAGVIELSSCDYIRNSFGALHGGVFALLIDRAGQEAARASTGMPLVTQDLNIYYLSQGKVGPFITNATVLRDKSDTIITRVEVRDSGANNRLLAVGLNTAALDSIVQEKEPD